MVDVVGVITVSSLCISNIFYYQHYKVEAKETIRIVQQWVRSWYFDTETANEYDLSRKRFFYWLENRRGNELPSYSVDKIKVWISNHLDPYAIMSLNHIRLHVRGLSQRTTSPGEALHCSMKSGFDKIFAAMTPAVSANTMMNKAQRKAKTIAKKMQARHRRRISGQNSIHVIILLISVQVKHTTNGNWQNNTKLFV